MMVKAGTEKGEEREMFASISAWGVPKQGYSQFCGPPLSPRALESGRRPTAPCCCPAHRQGGPKGLDLLARYPN